jgi:hypothetical protein
MKIHQVLFGISLLTISLGAAADSAIQTNGMLSDTTSIDSLNLMKVAPCRPSGDGTYVEMITTMASVLPPADADALITRYCEECFKRKFSLSQAH